MMLALAFTAIFLLALALAVLVLRLRGFEEQLSEYAADIEALYRALYRHSLCGGHGCHKETR